MTNIILTARLIDRDLTAPDRQIKGSEVLIVYEPDTRITRAGSTRITRGVNTRVAHNNALGYPILLKAPLVYRDLTAQERHG